MNSRVRYNPQSLKNRTRNNFKAPGIQREPKIKKARPRGIKTFFNGIEFDSKTEANYYAYLLTEPSINHIEVQPKYTIIEPYEVECKKCKGKGKIINPRTLRPNKCTRCNNGKVIKAESIYTADFKVTYIDGYQEVIDVKGHKAERDFPLRKRLWERIHGVELIVIRWDNDKQIWKRD